MPYYIVGYIIERCLELWWPWPKFHLCANQRFCDICHYSLISFRGSSSPLKAGLPQLCVSVSPAVCPDCGP